MTRKAASTTTAFTGRRRTRAPRGSVRVIDRLARSLITIGGLGSILAVSLVGVFLVWVAAPLFFPPHVGEGEAVAAGAVGSPLVIDEYGAMGWMIEPGGDLRVLDLSTGALLDRSEFGHPSAPTAWSPATPKGALAFGYADGSVGIARVDFAISYLDSTELPAAMRRLAVGARAVLGRGLVERTPENQFRLQEVDVELQPPAPVGDAAVALVDLTERPSGPVLAVLDAAGGLHFRSVRTRRNLFTGETTLSLAGGDLALGPAASERPPRHLRLDGTGDTAYLVWDDGRTLRIDAAHPAGPRIAETLDLVPEAGSRVTALEFLVGKTSLLVGDDAGRVRAWYRVRREDAAARDGATLLPAHELPPGAAAVTALAASSRSRMAAAGYADGTIALFQITGERRLAALRTPDAAAVAALALSPREGLLTAVAGDRLARWDIDAPHNESSLKTLLAPVWYEGYDAPAQVWQSTGGTDDFEPKYGLAPLIFGTLKATFYSMLFGLPIALLAAIYTSEFLHPRVRARVKPAVEMMASLPSVVLGFLAALVFAPVLADRLPTALAALVAVPFVLLLGAHVWQLLPARAATRLEGRRLLAIAAALPLGLLAAAVLGGPLERLLYAGDIMAWLDGQVGDGRGGWLMLLLPLSALAAALFTTRLIEPTLRRVSRSWSRTRYAAVDLVKFLVLALLALASAWLAATVLDAAGWDPRGHVLGTYVQRNALVVGFVMGFAVIPIIYTIAEDALGAVPDHLRAASLGAGATTWQTAIRVVVPPAMSGLFSAVMVGLGRAVGETMIVLMAAGNTPILDANLFNGFRTLSANIAVELPEAVQHSTHYRTLFLAALTLFAMTFVLNTVAEIVRLRFRRKAYQL